MSTATDLVADLQARGVTLCACGEDLLYDAPAGAMTPELKAELARRKPELLALLRQPGRWGRWAAALVRLVTTDPDRRADLMELFDERAGVYEYEGNLPREEAERRALRRLLAELGKTEILKHEKSRNEQGSPWPQARVPVDNSRARVTAGGGLPEQAVAEGNRPDHSGGQAPGEPQRPAARNLLRRVTRAQAPVG